MTAWERLKKKQEEIIHQLQEIERKCITISPYPTTDLERKMELIFCQMGLQSPQLYTVPSNYYDWSLEKRRDILKAPHIDYLCKSIILENTLWNSENSRYLDPTNSRFYCIVLQYTAKLQR
jgi:hypothetical protein